MSKIYSNHNPNFIIEGLNQAIDNDWVIATTKNGTRLRKRAKRNPNLPFSPAQLETSALFKEAVNYAKTNRTLPIYVDEGLLRGLPAYQIALKDFHHIPVIDSVWMERLSGNQSAVSVKISHGCILQDATIALKKADGTELVQGQMNLHDRKAEVYRFLAADSLFDGLSDIHVLISTVTISGEITEHDLVVVKTPNTNSSLLG